MSFRYAYCLDSVWSTYGHNTMWHINRCPDMYSVSLHNVLDRWETSRVFCITSLFSPTTTTATPPCTKFSILITVSTQTTHTLPMLPSIVHSTPNSGTTLCHSVMVGSRLLNPHCHITWMIPLVVVDERGPSDTLQ